MTSHPAPGTEGYDAWLDHQAGLADDELEEDRLARMAADEAISMAVVDDLIAAVHAAVQWLDVPTVLRTVAEVIEVFDQGQADDTSPY